MEIHRRATLHLGNLVLVCILDDFPLHTVLRLIDLAQVLLQLAELNLQRAHACAGCCIQLLCSERGKMVQLVASTGHMSTERRRDNLHGTANSVSNVLQMRRGGGAYTQVVMREKQFEFVR
jgi:hypothetical protein